jgi:hypothetical protein
MAFKKGDLVKHINSGAILIVTGEKRMTRTTEYLESFIGVRQLKGNLKGDNWFMASDTLELVV